MGKVTGDREMQYTFMDQSIQRWYEKYYQWLHIMSWASGLGIFIACLGMVGLTGLLIVNRTKEIGIRRVLGATTANILALLSKRYLLLITISFGIASPVAWHYGNLWLGNFAYHIELRYTEFIIPVLLVATMVIPDHHGAVAEDHSQKSER